MTRSPKGIPSAAAKAPARQDTPEPSHEVTSDVSFVDEKTYRVRLNGIADYLGAPLSPMHLHVVTGVVANAIRVRIAAFDPV